MIEVIEHIPVLLKESIELLNCRVDGIYVDCTINGGGHSEEILRRIGKGGRLIGIDQDEEAIEVAKRRLGGFPNLTLVKDNFRNLENILEKLNIEKVDGTLFDLGVSSLQLENPSRGFSFRYDAPLDMRMNRSQELSALDLVNSFSVKDLTKIFKEYGEEPWAAKIAKLIGKFREKRPLQTTRDLVTIVEAAIPKSRRPKKIHPATRVFLALRLVINRELECLEIGLKAAINKLNLGGRICLISYHSLEDRIIKNTFKDFSSRGILKIITKKPIRPSQEEIARNPRSRSAKLRAAERVS